jgi:SAM-dependent methyltransferase
MSSRAHTVFAARDAKELAAAYDAWSASYEEDMGEHGGPQEACEALCRHVRNTGRILDAGCGTGLAGKLLFARGYRNLEGLDLSGGMLREAAQKGCYTALHEMALGEALELPSATFDAVLVVGVFARAHAPSRSLCELLRITKPKGHVLFTLRPEFYAESDFQLTMTRLAETSAWRLLEVSPPFDGRFKEFPGIRLQVWVYEVLGNG